MSILGKVIGGLIGSIFGPIGFLLGLWLGHNFDKGINQNFGYGFNNLDHAQTQAVFFETSFAVMGHIAKADGIVTQMEIAAAEQVMLKLGLNEEKRKQAISAFSRGKSSDYNLANGLQDLIKHCMRKPSLIQMFLEIQIVAATADGNVSEPEMQILYTIGQTFRIPRAQIDRLIDMVIAQQSFHRDGTTGNYSSRSGPSIEQAYKVIGVNDSSNKQEVKRAYRKLMAQHHPDKLVSRGMPEEMIKVATEKSQEIQSAYEMIKNHKNF
jgi:DnaJ like chaperone protein